MIVTGEHKSSWRKPFPSANLSTTNPKRTGLGLKPELHCETPATNRLSHGSAPIRCIEIYGYWEVVNHCKYQVPSSCPDQFVGPTCIFHCHSYSSTFFFIGSETDSTISQVCALVL
jgi:hypothetical protein